jgi:putative transcriptional regulator
MKQKKKKFLNNLQKFRKEAGLTQDQFAALCKFKNGQARIANYESGLREPSLNDCRIIVGVLNSQGILCDLDQVFPQEKAIRA